MKRILLTTTALTALAGAAFAQEEAAAPTKSIAFSGAANLKALSGGEAGDVTKESGFDWGMNVNAAAMAELNNGVTAKAAIEMDVIDDELGSDSAGISDFVLSLTSDQGGFYFGDTNSAAATQWAAVGDMEADDFSAQDGGAGEVYMRADVNVAGFAISLSQIVGENAANDTGTDTDGDGTVDETYSAAEANLYQMSVGAKGAVGPATLSLAYQEESEALDATSDYNPNALMGVSASMAVAGATVAVGYASETEKDDSAATGDRTSTGIKADYVAGPVTAGLFFVMEDDSKDSSFKDNTGITAKYTAGPMTVDVEVLDQQGLAKNEVDVTYAMGNGLTVIAGMGAGDASDEGLYLGGNYDLGNGGTLSVVQVQADTGNADNEYFDGDYAIGTTVSVSFSF